MRYQTIGTLIFGTGSSHLLFSATEPLTLLSELFKISINTSKDP